MNGVRTGMNGIFRINGPGALPIIALGLVVLLIIILIPLLILGLAGAAFSRLGFTWVEAVSVIILMVIGYLINIPIWTVPRMGGHDGTPVHMVFDAFTGEPIHGERSLITVSLNLGGALIPLAVSVYLLHEMNRLNPGQFIFPLAGCIAAVAIVVIVSVKIIPEWGIRAPLFLPALAALACGILFTGGAGLAAAVTAFSGGTMGILIGTLIFSLWKGVRSGIRQISIGGSGTFGSILICTLFSALIA
ncbi:MAG: hypothetical protein A4E35_00178 [Methanoregula sp. PtaU1.Bin051]|nr:MAG: hypothetical protein A4E35_00178 [Methanoregula sp. PtaU1.Bin051]